MKITLYNFPKLLFGLLCISSINIYSQEEGNKEEQNLGTEVVNIVQSYKPSISKSTKLNVKPEISDIQDSVRKEVKYSIYSVPVASTFQPEKGTATNLKRTRKPKFFNNYARLGFGNYTSAHAEFFTNFNVGNKDELSIFLQHNSSQGGIKGVEIDDKFYRTNLDLEYNTKGQNLNVDIRGGVNHQFYNWYGMASPKPNLINPNSLFEKNNQSYLSGYLGSTIAVENSFFKQADVDFRVLTDSHSSSEIWLKATPEFIIFMEDMSIVVETDIAYLNGSFEKQYGSNIKGDNYGFFHAGILPALIYVDNDLSFSLGAKGYLLTDIEANETKFKVYPNIHASYKIVEEYMTLYGGATGGIVHNSFYSFKEENPFISPTLWIMPSSTTYKAIAGLKGKFTSVLGYSLQASYDNEENKALFALNDFVQQQEYSEGYEKAHSFNVVYDKMQTLSIEGELIGDISDKLQLGIYAAFHNYSTTQEQKAWNLPELEARFYANYKITDKIYTSGSLFFVGERKDRVFKEGSGIQIDAYDMVALKSYVDLNLQVSYQLTPQLNFFAKGVNLIGGEYKKWYAYPVQDIQFMLGATYQFDW